MRIPAKTFIIALISSVTFALGAAPASAEVPNEDFAPAFISAPAAPTPQSLKTTTGDPLTEATVDSVLHIAEIADAPHRFNVQDAIKQAESEIGTSRPTGWNAQGECIMSAQRWIIAGGGAWSGSGDPVSNYDGAARLPLKSAESGDIIQYEYIKSPRSWVTGVHTVMVTGVNDDGTFVIIESNNPGGSGTVKKNTHWTPAPPAGFQAVVWRF